MKRLFLSILILAIAYAATGFYVVRGNEVAVVRRCGRLIRNDSNAPVLSASGLHYDLPWPWAAVDRVNLHEVKTLTIGSAETTDIDGTGFLQSVGSAGESQFLTGDKNILNLQLTVQYRVSQAQLEEFLYASESPARRLARTTEAVAVDLVSRSGVDFVHPLGLGQLRELLTSRIRQLAERQRLGVDVDEVAISEVYPPARVKADFLDVANARADKQKYIHAANAYAEQRLAAAEGGSQQILDEARSYRHQQVEQARGKADRFTKVVAQFRLNGTPDPQARQMAMRRMYLDTVEEVFRDVAGKVILDSGKPVDLTIFRDPSE